MGSEGYLALRWNNHNAIFTKILNLLREQEAYTDVSLACEGRLYPAHKFVLSTCSDYFKEMFSKIPCKHPIVFMKDVTGQDLESLLDFMYKGEVHVPQSELGSLLRTAEGLQVKGLAVPDDAKRSGILGSNLDEPMVPSSAPQTHLSPNKQPNPSTFQVKRKRPSPDNKEEPPYLTPRPKIVGQNLSPSGKNPPKVRKRTSSMPELKRIKIEDKIRNNNTLISDSNNVARDFSNSKSPPSPTLPNQNSSFSEILSLPHLKTNFKVELDDDEPLNVEALGGKNGDTDGISGEEEAEEEEEEEEEGYSEETANGREGGGSSPRMHSEFDENSSLPNSEISTAELLQVDLSEDGTQFIISTGGQGEEASRGSSVAGDEDGNEAPKKPFICLLCGHTFTRRDNLANHLKTHTGDRPFMCQYCHKCFSRKDYLKQHERIHTGEKPYACEICSRAFTRKEGLTDHMRCHSDFKEFACETCGKSFKQKCGLRFHKRNYKH